MRILPSETLQIYTIEQKYYKKSEREKETNFTHLRVWGVMNEVFFMLGCYVVPSPVILRARRATMTGEPVEIKSRFRDGDSNLCMTLSAEGNVSGSRPRTYCPRDGWRLDVVH